LYTALTDEHQDTVTNPKLIVEVLSPSTADYDYEVYSLSQVGFF